MKLSNLEKCFNAAKENNAKYVAVVISTRGNDGNEIIINPAENFDKKLEYYKNAYTDDLVLKSYDGIKIVGFTYGNSFVTMQMDLMNDGDRLQPLFNAIETMEMAEMLDVEIETYTNGEYKTVEDLTSSLEDEISYAAETCE